MNIKTKFTYLAFVLSLTTTSSFGQTSLSDLSAAFLGAGVIMQAIRGDISATTPETYDPITFTANKPTGDLAVIDQGTTGSTSNDAYISQIFGTTDINIASISQEGDTNKAYIEQGPGGNVALINQVSDANLAYISQAAAITSIAGINQTAIAGNSAGYITQTGTTHSALIIQQ